MRVVFLGNHTVGVRSLEVIREQGCLVGVVAHPEDPEDGVRYESVFSVARKWGVSVVRSSGRNTETEEFVRACQPDLLWIADYRYLLPGSLLQLPKLGAVNLHPSLLPRYRGRAPINWAILHGETRLGLTCHFVDEDMDSGDIIAQEAYELDQSQDVGDALRILYPIYEELTRTVLTCFLRGQVPRRVQDHGQATFFPRRTPNDGRIDWQAPAQQVWNLIRAVASPYPGAFTQHPGGTLRVWNASRIAPFATGTNPAAGEIIDLSAAEMAVACGDAAVVISRFEPEGIDAAELQRGQRLS